MRKLLLTFVAIAASTTLVVNAPGQRGTGPEVRQRVRLAAQAAEVPVPRPLPVGPVESLSAVPPAAAAVPIAPPPEQFAGPAPARVAPPRQLQAAAPAKAAGSEPGTWAVVIGINDYPGSQYDLNYAVNDANDAAQALALQGVTGDHVLNLREGQVSPSVIKSSVAWLASHAGPDAIAVFFYAGHVMKRGGGEAIVTGDGGIVYDRDLAAWLRPLQARRAWITIAACYGGGFDEVLAPGRTLTAAAGPNDVAYESSAFGRSYLGEYMFRRAMIEGAANDTVQSAFAWARTRISQEYSGREPVELDYSDGHTNLRPASAAATSAPPQSGSSSPDQSTPPPPEPPPGQSPPTTTPPPKSCSLFCFR